MDGRSGAAPQPIFFFDRVFRIGSNWQSHHSGIRIASKLHYSRRQHRRCFDCNLCDVTALEYMGRGRMARICPTKITEKPQCPYGNARSRCVMGNVACTAVSLAGPSNVKLSLSGVVHRYYCSIFHLHLALQQHARQSVRCNDLPRPHEYVWSPCFRGICCCASDGIQLGSTMPCGNFWQEPSRSIRTNRHRLSPLD